MHIGCYMHIKTEKEKALVLSSWYHFGVAILIVASLVSPHGEDNQRGAPDDEMPLSFFNKRY